jgi:hypothetical protein
MWRDIRPSSSDYNIGKLKVSWYKLVIRHAHDPAREIDGLQKQSRKVRDE